MTFEQLLLDRIERSGDTSPGAYNLAADLLHITANEMRGWTNRCDDAMRIPDHIYDGVDVLRKKARE